MSASTIQYMNRIAAAIKTWENAYFAEQHLMNDFGYKVYGAGAYGCVVEGPDHNTVFKIVSTKKGINEDGWIQYAIFCMQYHNECSSLLKVYNMKKYDGFLIAQIERLSDNYYHPIRTSPRPGVSTRPRSVREAEVLGIIQEHPVLIKLEDQLGQFTDLHMNNWMLRGETPVITDPYGTCYSPMYKLEDYLDPATNLVGLVKQERVQPYVGPKVAAISEATALRLKEENRMLRAGQVVLGEPRRKGLSRVVFPVRPAGSDAFRPAWFEKPRGIIEGKPCDAVFIAKGPAETVDTGWFKLDYDAVERRMVAEIGNLGQIEKLVSRPVERRVKAGDIARIYKDQLANCGRDALGRPAVKAEIPIDK